MPKTSQKKKTNGQSKRTGQSGPSRPAPIATSSRQSFPAPKIRSRRVVMSELIQTVNGSTAFAATRFMVNPGIPATFPWLSGIASQWQQYKFHRLSFRYVTRCATTTIGTVILSPEYNPNDPPPTDEQQAANTQDAVSDVSWANLDCRMDVPAMFPLGPRKMIRSAIIPADLVVYDAGAFFMCTVEQSGATAIGKLYADYDVELFVPQNSPATTSVALRVTTYQQGAVQGLASGVNENLQWESPPVQNGLGLPHGTAAPESGIDMPAGVFRVDYSCDVQADSSTITAATANIVADGVVLDRGRSWWVIPTGAQGRVTLSGFAIVVTDTDDLIQLEVGVTTGNGTGATIVAGTGQICLTSV